MTEVVQTPLKCTALAPYVIVHYEISGLELLRVSFESGEEVLPVFSSGEAARRFLLLGAFEEDWRVRWCSTGELISLLFGPCANVQRVLLDPLPGSPMTEDTLENTVYRESFIASLIGTEA